MGLVSPARADELPSRRYRERARVEQARLIATLRVGGSTRRAVKEQLTLGRTHKPSLQRYSAGNPRPGKPGSGNSCLPVDRLTASSTGSPGRPSSCAKPRAPGAVAVPGGGPSASSPLRRPPPPPLNAGNMRQPADALGDAVGLSCAAHRPLPAFSEASEVLVIERLHRLASSPGPVSHRRPAFRP